ncbi:Tau-tubulin kinase 1-like, partial [Arapaima gigas]
APSAENRESRRECSKRPEVTTDAIKAPPLSQSGLVLREPPDAPTRRVPAGPLHRCSFSCPQFERLAPQLHHPPNRQPLPSAPTPPARQLGGAETPRPLQAPPRDGHLHRGLCFGASGWRKARVEGPAFAAGPEPRGQGQGGHQI